MAGAAARAHLIEMRATIIATLDRGFDGTLMSLLGAVQLGIDAIDAASVETLDAPAAQREDGRGADNAVNA